MSNQHDFTAARQDLQKQEGLVVLNSGARQVLVAALELAIRASQPEEPEWLYDEDNEGIQAGLYAALAYAKGDKSQGKLTTLNVTQEPPVRNISCDELLREVMNFVAYRISRGEICGFKVNVEKANDVINQFKSRIIAETLERASRECEKVCEQREQIAKRCNHGNDNYWRMDALPWMSSAAFNAADDCLESINALKTSEVK